MARNRPGGRRGAVRGRTQFRLPNGRFAKVDRTTGKILSIKADGHPYKGIVITPAPATLPRRHAGRANLPGSPGHAGRYRRSARTSCPCRRLRPATSGRMRRSYSISKIVSTSTATSDGNACRPTADRAWTPASPNTA